MAGRNELELEIDVTYEEDDDEDTAVMPLGAIRELLRQEAQVAAFSPRIAPEAGLRRPAPAQQRR